MFKFVSLAIASLVCTTEAKNAKEGLDSINIMGVPANKNNLKMMGTLFGAFMKNTQLRKNKQTAVEKKVETAADFMNMAMMAPKMKPADMFGAAMKMKQAKNAKQEEDDEDFNDDEPEQVNNSCELDNSC